MKFLYRPNQKRPHRGEAHKLKTFLDKLQDNSWNLELIVSGATILLLLRIYPDFDELLFRIETLKYADKVGVIILRTLIAGLYYAYSVLLTLFILHLLLRGFWIGGVGLRSVSDAYDLPSLRYGQRYEHFLRQSLKTFDAYIDGLEKTSSVTFALAFLLFFSICSLILFFVLFFGSFFLFANVVFLLDEAGLAWATLAFGRIGFSFFIVCLLFGLLYFIDFLSFGRIKRHPWAGKFYWPIYRVLGWVTLARLYRPIYYNVADSPFSRRIIRLYITGIIVIVSLSQPFDIKPYFLFPGEQGFGGNDMIRSHQLSASKDLRGVYLDEITSIREIDLAYPTLASRFAKEDYLELFVPYHEGITKTNRFMGTNYSTAIGRNLGRFILRDVTNSDQQEEAMIDLHRENHAIYLNDSLLPANQLFFYLHPARKQPGLIYQIPAYLLKRGRHLIRVERKVYRRDITAENLRNPFIIDTLSSISFYR